ncbi:hypothetical protein [Amaricoccus solimangrovi]|uniref:Uncharacterized protein n=1 Tax=Amaricoccus solimangrovi TaxID=2589815 RepID=A0A501WU34_9RHOB|nr:hypothetical protein [Amaricoccus solimangrovi]TPE53253.1 hypothetical protein FJM51_04335 [Amaricoccus solimangrovi]
MATGSGRAPPHDIPKFDEATASITTSYNLDDPFAPWIMAAGQPHEHLMVHFSSEDMAAMMGGSER